MIQKKRTINLFLKCILLFLFLLVNADSKVSIRTSADGKNINSENKIFVAIDFEIPTGEHITAPIGKGKSLAPTVDWKNAKILDVVWPKTVDLPEPGGAKGEYSGYNKNFTLIYSLLIEDKAKPIEYDLFYVVCGDACKPVQETGELKLNGLLTTNEIENSKDIGSKTSDYSFLLMILFGLLGGIILNCMPCVFPIISMKIFGIVKLSTSDEKENANSIKKHGLMFSIGTIATFLSLGSILLFLRQTAADVGWGFYMQEPKFIVCLLIAFLLCSLNFFGLYTLKLPSIKSVRLPTESVYVKSFFNGVFGAVVSAACVGPFAGVAIASALLYGNVWQSECIFAAIGLGVSSPFLAISLFPKLVKIFPKPGEWMEKFKEIMGFIMLFSCVWLLWVLSAQISISRVMEILFITIVFSMFVWMFGKIKNSKTVLISSIIGIILSGCFAVNLAKNEENLSGIKWKNYSDEVFDNLQIQKKPIFLNFTASWCLNCQFNHMTLEDKDIADAFEKNSVVALKCDWTNRNETITKLLEKFGASSVPFYVFYPLGKTEPIILPTMLTKKKVLEILNPGAKQ